MVSVRRFICRFMDAAGRTTPASGASGRREGSGPVTMTEVSGWLRNSQQCRSQRLIRDVVDETRAFAEKLIGCCDSLDPVESEVFGIVGASPHPFKAAAPGIARPDQPFAENGIPALTA